MGLLEGEACTSDGINHLLAPSATEMCKENIDNYDHCSGAVLCIRNAVLRAVGMDAIDIDNYHFDASRIGAGSAHFARPFDYGLGVYLYFCHKS